MNGYGDNNIYKTSGLRCRYICGSDYEIEHTLLRNDAKRESRKCYRKKTEPIYNRGRGSDFDSYLPRYYDDTAFIRADTTGNTHISSLINREWYDNYMSDKRCIICGEDTKGCLDNHHINPKTKVKDVSAMVSNPSSTLTDIITELNKCVILCLNCHRKTHLGIINIP